MLGGKLVDCCVWPRRMKKTSKMCLVVGLGEKKAIRG